MGSIGTYICTISEVRIDLKEQSFIYFKAFVLHLNEYFDFYPTVGIRLVTVISTSRSKIRDYLRNSLLKAENIASYPTLIILALPWI